MSLASPSPSSASVLETSWIDGLAACFLMSDEGSDCDFIRTSRLGACSIDAMLFAGCDGFHNGGAFFDEGEVGGEYDGMDDVNHVR